MKQRKRKRLALMTPEQVRNHKRRLRTLSNRRYYHAHLEYSRERERKKFRKYYWKDPERARYLQKIRRVYNEPVTDKLCIACSRNETSSSTLMCRDCRRTECVRCERPLLRARQGQRAHDRCISNYGVDPIYLEVA